MNASDKLTTAKINFEIFLRGKEKDSQFMTGMKKFLKDTNDVLHVLYDECGQTPAGEKLLKEKFKLSPAVNHFFQIYFNRAETPSFFEIFKSTNPKKIILYCRKYLRELESLIDSMKLV